MEYNRLLNDRLKSDIRDMIAEGTFSLESDIAKLKDAGYEFDERIQSLNERLMKLESKISDLFDIVLSENC